MAELIPTKGIMPTFIKNFFFKWPSNYVTQGDVVESGENHYVVPMYISLTLLPVPIILNKLHMTK